MLFKYGSLIIDILTFSVLKVEKKAFYYHTFPWSGSKTQFHDYLC